MPRWLTNLLTLLITLAIPPFLVISNVFLFMTPQWLDFQYSQPGFPKSVRFGDVERRYNAVESIEYVRGNRTLEQFKALGVYDAREIKHMVDVRELVDKVRVVWIVLGMLLVVAIGVDLTGFQKPVRSGVGIDLTGLGKSFGKLRAGSVRPYSGAAAVDLTGFQKPVRSGFAARGLLGGAALTIALFVALGVFAAVGFQAFFTLFHRVFFAGDTWLFNYTDSLIQFYPLPFWFNTSLVLVGVTVVEAVVIGAVGWWWQRRMKAEV
jgi:uncharacterized membrane protein